MSTAIVWGATGGIGRAVCAQLMQQGWRVYALARNSSALAQPGVSTLDADVSDPVSVRTAALNLGREGVEAQLLAYAAGDIASTRVEDTEDSVWARIIAANLTGAHYVTRYCLPVLAADAHLVFVGAVNERMRLPGLSAYAAAKAGLEAYADALRKELRGRKVTVVRPGAVDTPFWKKVPFKLPPNASSPDATAARILDAVAKGHSGQLDL
jgi:NAD(P)-dependent dehydrogenase (short-subunit alcohol dehydrogenase family)